MNEPDYPHLITTDDDHTEKNRFPIIMQLGILSFILVGIFGALLFQSNQNQVAGELPPPPVQNNTQAELLIPEKIADVNLRAEAAYVWDVRAQRALYAQNESTALPLASITKLMTALLSYELIEQNEVASISRNALLQEGSSGFQIGEQLRIEDLTQMALISSSNDAAYELAASVGTLLGDRDPVAQFVTGMNIRAAELGLESLEFKNMTGLDVSLSEPGSVGSARDVSFLMEHIIDTYPDILLPTREVITQVYNTNGDYHTTENTNEIVSKIPNLIGSKTGYTDLAGGNLTIAFDLGHNRPIIVTVLGSTRAERFTDVLTLVAAIQESIE
jgi:D-alanyl-D-alanine carboxypeptidase (penicillin-binding protein 5/6)